MKFGDTLYQRSVPDWATYNFKYNEIKQLIKQRTSVGGAGPVDIPNGPPSNRWVGLEDELIIILKDEYDNISLFLNSKRGEIERRLTFLEKQVRSGRRAAEQPYANASLQARRFHKLLADAESIGEDIQNLTRFASVQRTAFRKVLKKYRKWTRSGGLHVRVENEILKTGKLDVDYAQPLERLATQTETIKNQLQPSTSGTTVLDRPKVSAITPPSEISPIFTEIRKAEKESPLALDAALATLPLSKSSGYAVYWVHPDNLDEARALLLHHVREVHKPATEIPRQDSNLSITSTRSTARSTNNKLDDKTCMVYFDNERPILRDASTTRLSQVALSGRWCQESEAVVALSDLGSQNSPVTRIKLKRKDMLKALSETAIDRNRALKQSKLIEGVQQVRHHLAEHEDIKPLAQVRCKRSRYVGTSDSAQSGVWAILDRDIVFSPFYIGNLDSPNVEAESGEAFPHALLAIRWENCPKPDVVRTFDSTHLAEGVKGFTLESAAIAMVNQHLVSPKWKALLEQDIRKMPPLTRNSSSMRGIGGRARATVLAGMASGPSSDGPTDSVFSQRHTLSSATSVPSPNASTRNLSMAEDSKPVPADLKRKIKRARIEAQSPQGRQARYWNEFDDGDEDVNLNESYTIYVNPDESFPGVKTVSKAFGAMYNSISGTASRVSSMFSLRSQPKAKKHKRTERSQLLGTSSHGTSDEADSSDSDSTPTEEYPPKFGTFSNTRARARADSVASLYRTRQVLTPRQVALEKTYFLFYVGLIVLSFILLFMCGVLLATGRKRAYVEVDVAVIAGIVAAEVCAILSMILLWMRRTPLGIVHRGLVQLAIVCQVVIGIGEVVALVNRSK